MGDMTDRHASDKAVRVLGGAPIAPGPKAFGDGRFAGPGTFIAEVKAESAKMAVGLLMGNGEIPAAAVGRGIEVVRVDRVAADPEARHTRLLLSEAYQMAARNRYAPEGWDDEGGAPPIVAVDCGVTGWSVRRWRHAHENADAKWLLRWVVEVDGEDMSAHGSVSEAKAAAAACMLLDEDDGCKAVAIRRKPMICNGGNDVTHTWWLEHKVKPNKPKRVSDGTRVTPIRMWVVYGRK